MRQQFTQKERDSETGLDYFGARYYGSSQGRFISPDPLLSSGKPSEPQSWNRYSYCINNPLVYVDPSGMTITWLQNKNGTNYIGLESEEIINQYLADGWTRVQFDENGEYSYTAMQTDPDYGTSSPSTYVLNKDGRSYWRWRIISHQELWDRYISQQRQNIFAQNVLALAAGFGLGPLFEVPGSSASPSEGVAASEAENYAALLRSKGGDLPTATSAAVDTTTGNVFLGTSGRPLPSFIHPELAGRMPTESLEPWPIANCAEFKAVNNALQGGAKMNSLEIHTIRTATAELMPRCANCKLTTAGARITSGP